QRGLAGAQDGPRRRRQEPLLYPQQPLPGRSGDARRALQDRGAELDTSLALPRGPKEKGPSPGPSNSTLLLRLRGGFLGVGFGTRTTARRLGELLFDQLDRFGQRQLVDGGDLAAHPVHGLLEQLAL